MKYDKNYLRKKYIFQRRKKHFSVKKFNFSLTLSHENIIPVTSKEYSSSALRPKNSLLDIRKLRTYLEVDPLKWQSALTSIIERIDIKKL